MKNDVDFIYFSKTQALELAHANEYFIDRLRGLLTRTSYTFTDVKFLNYNIKVVKT